MYNRSSYFRVVADLGRWQLPQFILDYMQRCGIRVVNVQWSLYYSKILINSVAQLVTETRRKQDACSHAKLWDLEESKLAIIVHT